MRGSWAGRAGAAARGAKLPAVHRPSLRSLGRFRRRRVILVVALAVLGLLYYRPVHSYLHTKAALAQRAAAVRVLATENQRLQHELVATQTGGSLLRSARMMGLVKPGEHLFIVQGIGAWRRQRATARHH